VVCDTANAASGRVATNRRAKLVLPAPDGAERMMTAGDGVRM